jgi:N utilization substance protein A
MKNEFVLAFNEVIEDKGLPRQVILEAIEAAMVSAYRRAVNASSAQQVEARLDPDTGKVNIFAEKEIVEAVQDIRTEVSLQDARKLKPEVQLGEMLVVESTPRDFGRVAAQTARQVIQQRIREAERDSQMTHYSSQLGEIVSGIVQAVSAQAITLGLDMRAEGIMPRNQMMPGERFRVHDRVRSVLLEVKETPRGPQIILSRAHRNFLRRLLENEVPEIYHGMVEIRSIAREPGQRSKVAVAALKPGVDPVGACVGLRGVRIQTIVRELNDEKIDVIEWNPDPAIYIAKALSPARVSGVYLNDHGKGTKTATVVVPEDQLSLAIGRDGQNARLAAKLTSWRIDIKSLPEAATDALRKLEEDAEYATLAGHEAEIVPQVLNVLAKKGEGRSVMPEEYQVLTQFVDRVERGIIRQRVDASKGQAQEALALRAQIPAAAFEMSIEDLAISDKTYHLLLDAGYHRVGDLMLQIKLDPNAILSLPEVGARVMREIETILNTLEFPEPETAEVVAPAEEPVVAVVEEAPIPVAPEGVVETHAAPEAEMAVVEPVQAEGIEQPETSAPVDEKPAEEATATDEAELAPTVEKAGEDDDMLVHLFEVRPEVFDVEVDDEDDSDKKDKKGKKKKKFVEIEYDPDHDVTIAHKKRKRGEGWEGDW